MTENDISNKIFDIIQDDRIDDILNDKDHKYVILSRKDLLSMDPIWKDLFLNLLEEIPERKQDYFIRARGRDGRFVS